MADQMFYEKENRYRNYQYVVAEGETFDPSLHQAVQTIAAENDEQKDRVVKVLQKGYQYKDRTLRPAMVVVAQ